MTLARKTAFRACLRNKLHSPSYDYNRVTVRLQVPICATCMDNAIGEEVEL